MGSVLGNRILIAALVLLWTPLSLQARNHTLSGCVRDESGAPLHGAVVYLEEVEGATRYTLATDARGCYKQDTIPDGHFEVRAEVNGTVVARKQVTLDRVGPVSADLQFTPKQTSSPPAAPPMINLKMLAETAKSRDGRRRSRDGHGRTLQARARGRRRDR